MWPSFELRGEIMLDISLLQMKYVMEINKAGSISQAAKNLYMNQPNLSKAIRELEESIGITIFVRTPKGVILSKEGRILVSYIDSIFQKLEDLEEELQDRKAKNASFMISLPRATYITYAFTEFMKEIQSTPEIKINYRETNNAEAVDNILFNGFDMGIIRYTQPYELEFQRSLVRKNLVSREIWESEYLILMSEKHPLAEKGEIRSEDLKEYTELVHGDENYNKTNPKGDINKRIYLYERGSQFDLLRNVPTTYMWVSPLPDVILKNNNLIQRKCSDSDICFKDVLISRADYQLSQYANKFVTTLMHVKEEITNHLAQ